MRIGIIGLGDIAQKAYLPVITARPDIELIFCTRNHATLKDLASTYRVAEHVTDVDALIAGGIQAAFVHSATESHPALVSKLLRSGIHVYVDKPLSYTYEESRELVELAETTGRTLMVGFNRRFAPMYASLKEKENPRMILMQKNRPPSPGYARPFVYDDFIHVVDTLRFLAPGEIKDIRVISHQEDGRLHHVMLQLGGEGFTAVGIMNRDSGSSEEIVELMSPGKKWIVKDLNSTTSLAGKEESFLKFNDWDPVLYRRGFHQIIDHFLASIRENHPPSPSAQDSLETHRICELVVTEVLKQGAAAWGGE
ncbi:Gfo/Idh/MocA family protein [Paenibacillus sp. FJAT-26967]|uniref:Gfo/Idh/MocA family protein n=1 Tax=Paenibacillus sp. FJAT-26967 TaxID=1729690 RepID=UPI000838B79A|nr:Gfo/Idh/MocA family oxidoreductase [Paenibacillus sp. FJAT-26967]